MSNDLITNLGRCNRTERDALVRNLLMDRALAPAALEPLSKAIGFEVPADAFWAIDYKVDWISLALRLTFEPAPKGLYSNATRTHHASNQDFDLIAAWGAEDSTHLVMVEAKGVLAWDPKQLAAKMRRLESIFGQDGSLWPGVIPHIAITSPKRPVSMGVDGPSWVGPVIPWYQLKLPENRVRAERCNERGVRGWSGDFIRVRRDP